MVTAEGKTYGPCKMWIMSLLVLVIFGLESSSGLVKLKPRERKMKITPQNIRRKFIEEVHRVKDAGARLELYPRTVFLPQILQDDCRDCLSLGNYYLIDGIETSARGRCVDPRTYYHLPCGLALGRMCPEPISLKYLECNEPFSLTLQYWRDLECSGWEELNGTSFLQYPTNAAGSYRWTPNICPYRWSEFPNGVLGPMDDDDETLPQKDMNDVLPTFFDYSERENTEEVIMTTPPLGDPSSEEVTQPTPTSKAYSWQEVIVVMHAAIPWPFNLL